MLITPHQVHSAKAVYIKDQKDDMPAIEADALVTDQPGIALGVLAADCAPVLLADPLAGVIGAAHAGWRGAFDNILKSCVETMVEIGAEPAHIRAVIGPAISVRSYEVGEDFVANFAERYLTDTDLFVPATKEGHAYFNLPVFVQRQLARCGVAAQTLDICTMRVPIFFSPIGAQPILANAIMAVRYLPSHYHRLWIDVPTHKQRGKPENKNCDSPPALISKGIAISMVDWGYGYENSCGQ